MQKTENNLVLLNSIFITTLIIANIVSCKIVSFFGLVIPAAIVAYPITFLITDTIGEIWGKEQANNTVKYGIICQILSVVLIFIAAKLPIAHFANNQQDFDNILVSNLRIVIASLIAYICSQSWDVFIFHKTREMYIKKYNSVNGGKWIWNNISTMTSQLIDTAIFIFIAFAGQVPDIKVMVISQYLIKFIFSICDTPFFYLLTSNKDINKEEKLNGKKTKRNR